MLTPRECMSLDREAPSITPETLPVRTSRAIAGRATVRRKREASRTALIVGSDSSMTFDGVKLVLSSASRAGAWSTKASGLKRSSNCLIESSIAEASTGLFSSAR
jgi:hypothetical protein